MRVLHLTLKKKWFDMIARGEKKEEYREIKPYWGRRFLCLIGLSPQFFGVNFSREDRFQVIPKEYYKLFDIIKFRNGYSKDAPTITLEFKGIEIGNAKPEWSDNWQGEVFVIKLGEIIK